MNWIFAAHARSRLSESLQRKATCRPTIWFSLKGFSPMKVTAFSDSSLGSEDSDRRRQLGQESTAPSDSSLARQRWEGEGGACTPPGPFPDRFARAFTSPAKKADLFELITLPFSEYSAVFPDRMSNLQARSMPHRKIRRVDFLSSTFRGYNIHRPCSLKCCEWRPES